ncbi:MAG: inorganic phosphate transporter [Chitinophagaceae bacterium]|nr:inorganic phosphate transporter [Chitinophagaceae bacterium]
MKLTHRLLRKATPKANYFFKLGQIPTAIALALSHGANDAQKTMGVITLGLVITGYQTQFVVPFG